MKFNRVPVGATIGIFSPSEPITVSRKDRFDRGLHTIEEQGFGIRLGKHVFAQRHYMSGSPSQRAEDIHDLADDSTVSALLASWGGKSCNQLLRFLDFDRIAKARKPILAFSDGCVLLNAIAAKTGMFTVHGPNVAGKFYESGHPDLKLLREDLCATKENLLGRGARQHSKILKPGQGQGRTFGGNLSTFTLGLLGSQYMPRFSQGILFWESGGESIQTIDQYLTCLRNAGVFESLRGMVIGDFIREESTAYKIRDPFEMIGEVLEGYDFPVLYCPTFGHPENLENHPIPIGPMCELDTRTVSLTLLEPVLE